MDRASERCFARWPELLPDQRWRAARRTYAFSANTILDFRAGFERFEENALPRSQGMFNPASIGFTAATATQLNFPAYQYGANPEHQRVFSR